MNILKQFESLTKDEILLLCDNINSAIEIGKDRVSIFNETYDLYKDNTSLIIDRESLEKSKEFFEKYEQKIKSFEKILDKLKAFEDILKD